MNKTELAAAVAARKAELAEHEKIVTQVKAQVAALGDSPGITKLTTFLKTMKDIVNK